MSDERWPEFWRERGRTSGSCDPQSQVLRTSSKQPIASDRWSYTLHDLEKKFRVQLDDDLLDLACGNGLFATHFAPRCRSVMAVDISPEFLSTLEAKGLANLQVREADMRHLEFRDASFSRILIYAGLQYLSEGETVVLFRKMARWLRPGGLLFIGDVPDRDRLFDFYDTDERRQLYFDNCVMDRDVVGTWFQADWLVRLAETVGMAQAEVLAQPVELIYAHFRFDLRVVR